MLWGSNEKWFLRTSILENSFEVYLSTCTFLLHPSHGQATLPHLIYCIKPLPLGPTAKGSAHNPLILQSKPLPWLLCPRTYCSLCSMLSNSEWQSMSAGPYCSCAAMFRSMSCQNQIGSTYTIWGLNRRVQQVLATAMACNRSQLDVEPACKRFEPTTYDPQRLTKLSFCNHCDHSTSTIDSSQVRGVQ